MSNFDSDIPSDNEWEDRGELAWNEFDWENYLRGQDEMILRYIAFYEKLKGHPERLDEVAHQMGWDEESWSTDGDFESSDAPASEDAASAASEFDAEPYTLHKNPIFIATKAIYVGLNLSWQTLAVDPAKVPQAVAINVLASLNRGEEHSVQAIHALDFGDYAMAVSLFKRALSALNGTLTLLNDETIEKFKPVLAWRQDAIPSLFDLREIWLRVMAECREELERPMDEES